MKSCENILMEKRKSLKLKLKCKYQQKNHKKQHKKTKHINTSLTSQQSSCSPSVPFVNASLLDTLLAHGASESTSMRCSHVLGETPYWAAGLWLVEITSPGVIFWTSHWFSMGLRSGEEAGKAVPVHQHPSGHVTTASVYGLALSWWKMAVPDDSDELQHDIVPSPCDIQGTEYTGNTRFSHLSFEIVAFIFDFFGRLLEYVLFPLSPKVLLMTLSGKLQCISAQAL